ncbi:MAG: hypothetical protein HDT20_08005 [Oscillibacter sp.]|nr:hypothetical protein [Oscillibacter sp.]
MGTKSQRKGRKAELELARILQGYGYPVEAGRAQSYGEVPDLTGLPGIHIECKRTERTQIWEWMEQSQRDTQRFKDGVPSVIFRRSRSKWLICMELSNFLTFYSAAERSKNPE